MDEIINKFNEVLFDSLEFMSNHNHSEDSNFRLKDCIIRAEDIINRAIELECSGVSITDHETVSAHIRILQRYKELKNLKLKYEQLLKENKQEEIQNNKNIQKELHLLEKMKSNFKLGLGNEIYLIDNIEDVTTNYVPKETKFWHFILIAKNKKGHEQLRQISSESAWKNWFKHGKMERVPTIKSELEEIIGEKKGNLIATTACLGGEFPNLLLSYVKNNDLNSKRKIHQLITWGINIFGKENFFIELQPTILKENEEGELQQTEQSIFNKNAIKIANSYNINYIVATDSHYLKKEDRAIHESYLNADDDNSSNRELGDFYETTYMMGVEELTELLSNHLTKEEICIAINNTMKIHEMIEDYDLAHDVIVPRDKNIPNFKVKGIFENWYDECEYIKKFAESDDIQERYFLYKCELGFLQRKQEFNEENIQRINIEMKEIWESSDKINMRIAPYYVLVENLINNIMWKVSYIGIARGSITGFYTGGYLMGISQMNPIKYKLPHWRHLSSERPELPDIDIDSEASKRHLIFEEMKKYYGFDNVLNIITLKTEGSKSTVLTACRGLYIENDIAQAIADLIPFERGSNWTLSDCFYGNVEKNRSPITEFIREVNKYERLKETMLMIEGLVCGRSIHASGVYVFDNGYLVQNSRMRAPNGSFVTAWTMHDSDYAGGLKVDCLTIKALDKIHTCVDLLIKNNLIEDKGTIKETYNNIIHPDILDYETKEMWDMIANNSLIDAFQFDTEVGSITAKKVKPTSIQQLAVANSLMRLMADDGNEQPIDIYVKYKNNIQLWYEDMKKWGLNKSEIEILEPHLLPVFGVADTQEVVMELTMDKNISNFNVVEANKMRKGIAKKDQKILEEVRDMFYNKAKSIGTRFELMSYVWEVQIKMSLGYSFSKNHTMPYSGICIQEMNLAHKFNKIYWNTSCLTVNSGADEENENNKNTQYGKIAKAIGEIQKRGQKVALPNINKAKFSFIPDIENQEIIFGLKGICGIGDDDANIIVKNQPYHDFDDFLFKNNNEDDKESKIGNSAIITLIKAGAFDKLLNKDRKEIMRDFIIKISEPINELKIDHILIMKELNLLTEEQINFELRLYRFRKYIFNKALISKQIGKSDSTIFYRLPNKFSEDFFYENFETNMIENKDYDYDDNGNICVKKGSLDREYKKLMNPFKEFISINNKKILKSINEYRFNNLWQEKANGTVSQWEMESLSFYHGVHELSHVKKEEYLITEFDQLPEIPIITEYYTYRGKERPRFKLDRICGTVLDRDKNKQLVTILTPSDVVTVKFYKGQFGFYDKQISEINEEGKKTILEKSWFTRGNKLLITGFRREDRFVPKKYVDSAYRHTLQLIQDIDEDGNLTLISEREGDNE